MPLRCSANLVLILGAVPAPFQLGRVSAVGAYDDLKRMKHELQPKNRPVDCQSATHSAFPEWPRAGGMIVLIAGCCMCNTHTMPLTLCACVNWVACNCRSSFVQHNRTSGRGDAHWQLGQARFMLLDDFCGHTQHGGPVWDHADDSTTTQLQAPLYVQNIHGGCSKP